jgi:hypothetical protein
MTSDKPIVFSAAPFGIAHPKGIAGVHFFGTAKGRIGETNAIYRHFSNFRVLKKLLAHAEGVGHRFEGTAPASTLKLQTNVAVRGDLKQIDPAPMDLEKGPHLQVEKKIDLLGQSVPGLFRMLLRH